MTALRAVGRRLRGHVARFVLWLVEHESLIRPRVYGDRERLMLGTRVIPNDALFNTASGCIEVHEDVFFGHGVQVLTGSHDIRRRGRARAEAIAASGHDVVIERGAWLASGCIVIGPCRIGANAVVAAGAVVIDDVAAETVVAGVPARPVARVP